MSNILHLACDESGHTGPDLLDIDQRYFGYAFVNIDDKEAADLLREARAKYPVQMPELKTTKLIKSRNGQRLISHVFDRVQDRFTLVIHDKLMALCGWIFEYIYEPVFLRDPSLLYQKNFHRFVANYCWLWFNENQKKGDAADAVRQFQAYMRSKNADEAPLLFQKQLKPLTQEAMKHPFELVQMFATGYRDRIVADNARLETTLPDGGKWTLDLSTSAVWSQLNHWGGQGKELEVQCDASGPLQASIVKFKGDETDPGIMRARAMGMTHRMGWKLAKPITFSDSKAAPAIQVADIVAGTAVYCHTYGPPEDFQKVCDAIDRACLQDSIFPDLPLLNFEERGPAVNWLMMFDMAQRAVVGADPYADLARRFWAAEVTFARGDFKGAQRGRPKRK